MSENASESGKVLVVGAGIAGLQSALDLAKAGAHVYLVDKSPAIGGAMAQLDSTAPEHAGALCRLSPMLDAVRRHPNITVITNAELGRLSRDDGAFKAQIRREPLRVTDACDGCGDCVLVCPVKPYDRFNEGLMLRTAIDIQNTRHYPALHNIEKETPICQETCPIHIDIRRYVGLVAQGHYEEALAVVREKNPLPAICGRVCPHPCEAACNRGRQDEPVAIDAIKRFVTDWETARVREGKLTWPAPPRQTKKKKVAIVGAGPAGLTVAHDLAWRGYPCTVFEAAPVPGGMLWLGIPEYRLPRDIISTEVDYIANLGVEFKYETPLGPDLTVDDLLGQGFDAVFLGIGAHQGLKLGVPGEDDFEGFLDCIVFLRRVNLGDASKPGEKVVVIGGGNSAIDAARTALRLGSKEVSILYRRTRHEMPASSWEIDEAIHEGVNVQYLAAPIEILGEGGKVVGMRCTRMGLGKLDESGRRRPVPVAGSEYEMEADVIVPSISQEPDISFLHEEHGLEISRWNSFVVDRKMATNRPGIFSAGDAVTGPQTVIAAIADAHTAADTMDEY